MKIYVLIQLEQYFFIMTTSLPFYHLTEIMKDAILFTHYKHILLKFCTQQGTT